MSGARERLAEALMTFWADEVDLEDAAALPDLPEMRQARDAYLNALLPVVQALMDERAAAELEKAAEEQQAEHEKYSGSTWGTHAGGHGCAADHLRARAAALRAATGEGAT